MRKLREEQEIISDINNDKIIFNKDTFFRYVEWDIETICKMMLKKEYVEVKKGIPIELFEKLSKNTDMYRITENIDHVKVHNVRLIDYRKKGKEKYIQVQISIIFYDRIDNALLIGAQADNYWNDLWIVTYQKADQSTKNEFECSNCSAKMKFITRKDVLECEYCGAKKFFNQEKDKWKICDIEKI